MGKLEELVLRELDIFRRKFYELGFLCFPILRKALKPLCKLSALHSQKQPSAEVPAWVHVPPSPKLHAYNFLL